MASSKYDIEGMPWCWGPACSALKKSWREYKIAGRNGEPRGDIAWRINRIQSAMGIEKSQFPELEGMIDEESEEELTDEEIQLRREEKEESGGEWNLNFGTSEKRSELYTEWSEEDKELQREEREAEEENDWCALDLTKIIQIKTGQEN